MKVVLVYQAGIANVFRVSCFNLADYGRDATRLMQSDFRTCETFARGMAAAGAVVHSVHCNQAGDVARALWSTDLESAPFNREQRPVFANTFGGEW